MSDLGQVAQFAAPPTARLLRAGASQAQANAVAAWWATATTSQRIQHGLHIEQYADSDVLGFAQSWPPILHLHPANRELV